MKRVLLLPDGLLSSEPGKVETMANPKLEVMLAVDDGIPLCWLGNLSWLIRAQGRLIAFDLDLHQDIRLNPSPIPAEEIAPVLDVHFITHWHGDHFNGDTCRILAKESRCLFVIPSNCRDKAIDLGIPEDRLHIARPREPFDLSDLHVEPQRALHGGERYAVYRHANLDDCGYLLTAGGKKFLQPGDTVLLEEHLEFTDVDVLFVSPTVHNTHVDHSAILINAIEPEYIFPQHFGTYAQEEGNIFWTRGYPDELKSILPKPMQKRYHKLEQGSVFVVT